MIVNIVVVIDSAKIFLYLSYQLIFLPNTAYPKLKKTHHAPDRINGQAILSIPINKSSLSENYRINLQSK